jgi:hypothetical protein
MLLLCLLCSLLAALAAADPSCPPGAHILTTEVRPSPGTPPSSPPSDLLWAYTRCGQIPVAAFFVDDTNGGRGTRYTHGRKDIVQRMAFSAKELSQPPPRLSPGATGSAASHAHLVAAARLPLVRAVLARPNASVVVFGSNAPSVEALLLAAGAGRVLTVEYNALAYDHPSIATATPAEVQAAWAAGNASLIPPPRSFDLAVSISSFDHDGLGRYGDPLAPDGDLLAMLAMASYLKPDGLALVSVPVGPDVLWFNLMRTYGPVRLPLLLQGWHVHERVGWRGGAELEGPPNTHSPGKSHEPVFVLSKEGAAAESEGREL